jgi:excisionase family DNA binding protein
MSGFHSHDDDFLYEFQRTHRTQDDVIEGQLVGFRTEAPNKRRKTSENKYTPAVETTTPRSAPVVSIQPNQEFFTQKEAAVFMRCSYWTIREACYTGDLPCAKMGKRFVIHVADLRAWFEKQKTFWSDFSRKHSSCPSRNLPIDFIQPPEKEAMRTKRALNTLKKEKAKLDHESDQIGRAISVLEGRAPGEKRYKHSKLGRARISAAKRLWWQRHRAQQTPHG